MKFIRMILILAFTSQTLSCASFRSCKKLPEKERKQCLKEKHEMLDLAGSGAI